MKRTPVTELETLLVAMAFLQCQQDEGIFGLLDRLGDRRFDAIATFCKRGFVEFDWCAWGAS